MDCEYKNFGLCANGEMPTFGQVCNPSACGRKKGDIVARREEIYCAALDKNGMEEQQWHAVEELAEMLVALCHVRRGHDCIPHLAEEIADAQIMLDQMTLLYGCTDLVERYKRVKLLYLANKIGFEL